LIHQPPAPFWDGERIKSPRALANGERVGKAGPDLLRSLMERRLMRDVRDAKAMARSLRNALRAKAVHTTHSECLELIAQAFGCANWNILSARIDALQPPTGSAPGRQNPAPQGGVLYCSFCGKSQHHVRKLVAGPAVYICDECVALCTDITDEQLLQLMEGDAESARAMSTDRLRHYVEHATKGVERNHSALQRIGRMLALREMASSEEDSPSTPPDLAQLESKTSDELRGIQRYSQDQLKRYEQALRTVTPVLSERTK
jgi:hypothetical protein